MVTWPTENKFGNCQKDECQWKLAFAILQYKITSFSLSLFIYIILLLRGHLHFVKMKISFIIYNMFSYILTIFMQYI